VKPACRPGDTGDATCAPTRFKPWLLLALNFALAASAWSREPAAAEDASASDEESMRGHGSISIGYQSTLVNGFLKHDGTPRPIGTVRINSINLNAEYFLADRWAVTAGLPFIQSRYLGPAPHCPTREPAACRNPDVRVPSPEHPESRFLDDGNRHGSWQDWNLGFAWHAQVGSYSLTPAISVLIPSHDYPFFAQSAVGQQLVKLAVGVELAHQFDFTNVYYRAALHHVFAEKTLGISIDHNKLDVELGWFINADVSLKTFATWKRGKGITTDDPRLADSETYYHHDQIASHEYFNIGLGMDYRIDDRHTLSTSAQTLHWGQSVYNLQYSFDVQLTRSF
jgi:hypothetical protein